MRTQPYALKDHIVIMGQSQGGWISLAASTMRSKRSANYFDAHSFLHTSARMAIKS